MNDSDIIHHIEEGGYLMERCLEAFYRDNIRFISMMSRKYELDREVLMDAYSDAVIDFKEQVRKHQFKRKSKCSTYFYSIFNNKCIDILRRKTTNIISNEIPEYLSDTDPDIIHQMTFAVQKQVLDKMISRLGSRCREILMDWNDGYSMEEIARRNHLLNANVARSKRYSCLQQLMVIAGKSSVSTDREDINV
jgi:RNA polymerase sigma factor (sigma-70 family)